MDNQGNVSGYGRRPLWQWILFYIVIGGIVYGAIYYFTNRPYTTPTQNTQPAQVPQNQAASPSPTTGATNPPSPTPTAAPATKSFTVHANDTSADLTTITVSKGTLVQITFNVDAKDTYHGGLDFRSSVVSTGAISPGNSKTISFTANNSFTFIPYWPSTNIQKSYTINVIVK